MAEGLCRHYCGEKIHAVSAGIVKHGLNPLAVRAMAEIGIDISAQVSKTIADLGPRNFDYVITVCANADETCPVFPGMAKKIHHGFDDPPRLAAAAKSDEEALPHYRRVRDEIKALVLKLPAELGVDEER